MKTETIRLWQVDDDKCQRGQMFASYHETISEFGEPTKANYKIGYEGEVPQMFEHDVKEQCEILFAMFNDRSRYDYRCRSMSTSDVVEIVCEDGKSRFFYCDSFDFVELKKFD